MKILAVVRDISVILLFAVLTFWVVSEHQARLEQRRVQEVRLEVASKAIAKLDALYKTAVYDGSDNKGVYHQIFRQNEVLLEYQKLLLTTAYLPAPASEAALPAVPAPSQ